MKIVIPGRVDISEYLGTKLAALDVETYEGLPAPDELKERIKEAELLIAPNYVAITREVIDSAPDLRYIIAPATGYETIDFAYARSKDIAVLNCPTHNSQAVAEHAIALLLAVCRKILPSAESIKQGKWEYKPYEGMELAGKKMGLVGYGNAGKSIAAIGKGFGMPVGFVDSKSSDQEVDDLLSVSDVICVCAPLNDRTRHMIDERRLGLVKADAILINVARGAIVDQAALVKSLESGQIAGAGLDVFEDEPLHGPPGEAILRLAKLSNVVATPHIAYNTAESREKLGRELYADIESCLSGKPQNVVN